MANMWRIIKKARTENKAVYNVFRYISAVNRIFIFSHISMPHESLLRRRFPAGREKQYRADFEEKICFYMII
jgi:hypothetical protein